MKVDFFIVGPQKCGTTWLYENFKSHPDLTTTTPPIKETFFFDLYYSKGLYFYSKYFNQNSETRYIEFAPSYFDVECVPTRIFDYNPNSKIIIGIREPLSLVESMYNHFLKKGLIRGSFTEASKQNTRILNVARYSIYMPMWMETFGEGNVFIYQFEDIKTQPVKLLNEICDFLNLSHLKENQVINEVINETTVTKSILLQRLKRIVFSSLRNIQATSFLSVLSEMSRLLPNAKKRKIKLTKDEADWVKRELKDECIYYRKLIDLNK